MSQWITLRRLHDLAAFLDGVSEPIVLVLEAGTTSFCGQVLDGVFGYRLGAQTPSTKAVVRDFLDYETAQGRTPLLFALGDVCHPDPAQAQDAGAETWVVHSTDRDAGKSILRGGRLRSSRWLRGAGVAFRSFGREALGEPADYADLIHVAPLSAYGPEIVVASKEHGRFCSDADGYRPGMRFYFRVADLQAQPGYTRFMGGHAVRSSLSLDRVAHRIVSPSHMPDRPVWTPRTFTDAANKRFEQMLSGDPGADNGLAPLPDS